MILDQPVECTECGDERRLADWIENDVCPECGTAHLVPRLHVAVDAIESGKLEGWKFQDLLEKFGLDHDDAANLLLVLGVSAEAAFDVERTVVQEWERSEWRRLIDETREEEREHFEEVERVLSRYGVALGLQDD
ncbi:MAG: hypothetical protein SXQ77_10480 [Halobacteria archaeon]|nr:hypothetical protein [Halobacteria archaeon]